MKKLFRFLSILWIGFAGVWLISCNRHSNYEETMEGRLVVLNEPYKCQNWCNKKYYKVVAHFVINEEFPDSLILATLADTAIKRYPHFKICGSLPKECQKPGVQRVSVSLKADHGCFHTQEARLPTGVDPYGDWYFYKLTSVNEIQ
jgi:hypothetical protein